MYFNNRYGESEECFEGFFILLLIEIVDSRVHTELAQALLDTKHERKMRSLMAEQDFEKKETMELLKLIKLAENHQYFDLIKAALVRLLELNTYQYFESSSRLNFTWALTGHRKLLQFSFGERQAFMKQWNEFAGKKPLVAMLDEKVKFSNFEQAIADVLEIEINAISESIRELWRTRGHQHKALAEELQRRIKNFARHSAFAQNADPSSLDRKVFESYLMHHWLKMIGSNSLYSLPKLTLTNIQKARAEATENLARCLSPENRFHWCMREAKEEIRFAENESGQQLLDEMQPIIDKLLEEATLKVLAKFERTEIDSTFLNPEFGNTDAYDICNPKRWLRPRPERFKKNFDQLVLKSAENSMIHKGTSDNPSFREASEF